MDILDILAANCKFTQCTTLLGLCDTHEEDLRLCLSQFCLRPIWVELSWAEFSWVWAQVRGAASAVSTVCSRAPGLHPVPSTGTQYGTQLLGAHWVPGLQSSTRPGTQCASTLQDPDGRDSWPSRQVSRLNLWTSLLYLKVYASWLELASPLTIKSSFHHLISGHSVHRLKNQWTPQIWFIELWRNSWFVCRWASQTNGQVFESSHAGSCKCLQDDLSASHCCCSTHSLPFQRQ